MRPFLCFSIHSLALLWLAATSVSAQIDPSIPLRGQYPQTDNPIDTALKIQRLKLQQQEIQRRQEDLDRYRRRETERQQQATQQQSTGAGHMKVPPLATLLTPDTFAATGLARLDPSETARLDAWFSVFLDRYTKTLYDEFTAQRSAGSSLDARSTSILNVSEDGEVIRLLDGSEWQVQAGENLRSALWLSSFDVLVVQSGSDAMLIHDRDAVHARRIR